MEVLANSSLEVNALYVMRICEKTSLSLLLGLTLRDSSACMKIRALR